MHVGGKKSGREGQRADHSAAGMGASLLQRVRVECTLLEIVHPLLGPPGPTASTFALLDPEEEVSKRSSSQNASELIVGAQRHEFGKFSVCQFGEGVGTTK